MESVNNDYIVFKENTFFQNGLSNLEEFRQEGKFCDVTVKSFKAHKVVLAATIPYFHAMFTVEMLESNSSEVTLQGIEAETLKSLLNFIYSGEIKIDTNTVQSLLVGANYLQLTQVKDACADFMILSGEIKIDTNTVQSLLVGANYLQLTQVKDACADFMILRLKPSNVLGASKLAEKLNCPRLVESYKKFIEKNFPAVSLCDEFLDLTADEMMNLLDNDELNVSSEEEVFEALVRWFQEDPLSRKQHLPQVLCKLRLTLISLDYLMDNVIEQEFIKSSPECRELIDEVKDYFLMLQRRKVLPKHLKTEPRCCVSRGDHTFAIENSWHKGKPYGIMEVYDPLVGKWSSSILMNEKLGMEKHSMAVAVVKKIVYFIGGCNDREDLNTVQTFDTVTNRWSHISPMQIPRRGAGAGVLKGKLYVCGGESEHGIFNFVECFDSHIWRIVKSTKYCHLQCAAASLNGYLYVAGGGHKVERYDPDTDEWTVVAPMLTSRYNLGMTALNGKLYACGGYNGNTYAETYLETEMYNPEDDTWQMVAPMNKRRSGLTLVATKGKLWAIGGSDGWSELSCVEIYDPILNKWTFGPSMINAKGEVAIGIVPLLS